MNENGRKCAIDGCLNPYRARGYCSTHYNQQLAGLQPGNYARKPPAPRPQKPRVRKKLPHGTPGGYSNWKCRCDDCREAWNAYCVTIRALRREDVARNGLPAHFQHGTPGGFNRGCRCEKCSRANTAISSEYKATAEIRERIFIEQGGACGICGKVGVKLNLDHIHGTSIVRGLLCHGCNTGLGKLGDSAEGLRKALAYLEQTEIP